MVIAFSFMLLIAMSAGAVSVDASSAETVSKKHSSTIKRFFEEIKVKGLKHHYRILVVSDMHIIDPKDPSIVRHKMSEFRASLSRVRYMGESSASRWKKIAAAADSYGAEAGRQKDSVGSVYYEL